MDISELINSQDKMSNKVYEYIGTDLCYWLYLLEYMHIRMHSLHHLRYT